MWVTRWVDYSSKYGLGYSLSNHMTGVYFNDNTKLVQDLDSKQAHFFYREDHTRIDSLKTFGLADYPKELEKKMLLIKHFSEYLNGKHDDSQDQKPEVPQGKVPTYVKKWLRTKHAILFRLNNKVVQVCFQDNTEILICSDSRLVTYVTKQGTRETWSLKEALESSDQEMIKRLKYAKDIV